MSQWNNGNACWNNGKNVNSPFIIFYTVDVNFTNILQAAFAPISFCQKITNPNSNQRKAAQTTLVQKTLVCKIFCEIPSLMCFVSEFGGHDCRDDYIQEIPCNGSTPVQAVNETAKCYRKNFL